jgi:hypothetical protein
MSPSELLAITAVVFFYLLTMIQSCFQPSEENGQVKFCLVHCIQAHEECEYIAIPSDFYTIVVGIKSHIDAIVSLVYQGFSISPNDVGFVALHKYNSRMADMLRVMSRGYEITNIVAELQAADMESIVSALKAVPNFHDNRKIMYWARAIDSDIRGLVKMYTPTKEISDGKLLNVRKPAHVYKGDTINRL